MGDNLKLGFIILLTGIVIVFAVLVLLICIIFVYGDIVSSIQKSIDKKKKEKEQAEKENEPAVPIVAEQTEEPVISEDDEEEIPLDVVAAIAAAVDYIFGQGSVKIKSVKRSSKRRSAWKSAGVAENTRSFY